MPTCLQGCLLISGGIIRLITHHSSLITKTRRRQAGGFTLLEILVAVFILGVVVTTVLSSFNMVFSNAEALETSASTFEMGRSCMARITRDLENAFILMPPLFKPPALDTPPDPYRFQGSVENRGGTALAKLRFTSLAHVPLEGSHAGGIAEIVYYVQAAPDGGLRLKRAYLENYRGERGRRGNKLSRGFQKVERIEVATD